MERFFERRMDSTATGDWHRTSNMSSLHRQDLGPRLPLRPPPIMLLEKPQIGPSRMTFERGATLVTDSKATPLVSLMLIRVISSISSSGKVLLKT